MNNILKKIVTSLEISRQLKELGVLQKSLFYWSQEEDDDEYYLYHQEEIENILKQGFDEWDLKELEIISAFTLKELIYASQWIGMDENILAKNIIKDCHNPQKIQLINEKIEQFWREE